MSYNPRLTRLLLFEPERSARDSTVQTVHRVATRLIRAENQRRLPPNHDPAAVLHVVEVEVCLLGRRGLSLALFGDSLENAMITKSYLVGGTRHEHLPIHITFNPGVGPSDLSSRLGRFRSSLDGPFTLELQKWQPDNWSSTTYLPSGGSLFGFLETLPVGWQSLRWKRRRDDSWVKQRVPFHVSL